MNRRWSALSLGAGSALLALLTLVMLLTLGSGPAWAAPGYATAASIPARRMDLGSRQAPSAGELEERWLAQGEDDPERVMSLIQNAGDAPEGMDEDHWWRILYRTRGVVAARSGLSVQARLAATALQTRNREGKDRLLQGDEALVLASLDAHLGHSESAARYAAEAEAAYAQACSEPESRRACDHRPRWMALRLLGERAENQGNLVEARTWASRAAELARDARDPLREAWSLSTLAWLNQNLGEPEAARAFIAQAQQVARGSATTEAMVRVRINEARLARVQGDAELARSAMEDALTQAKSLDSERLNALILVNLADTWLHAGLPQQALDAVNQAMPVLKQHSDLRYQPLLLHNGGLARLQLGQVALGRADLEAALGMWERTGAKAPMILALQEHSDALAELGDVRGALDLYHRESRLRAEITKGNREALITEMKERYRSEAEKRELSLLERDNALKQARIGTQSLTRKVWALAATAVSVLVALAMLLVLRARDANARLRRSEALLRVQSDRDALTGLANRRRLREVLEAESSASRFIGALLLLDIDHFKRVNDQYGHPAGDAVLIEVARRLSRSVRGGDLVCRWGGEEFLVWSRDNQAEGLEALARRILHAVGDVPLTLPDGRVLEVTVSVGYGRFPLPYHRLALHWERALQLVDQALYCAKNLGRDRAVGLLKTRAADLAALAALEQDFEFARLAGDVALRVETRRSGTAPVLAPRPPARAVHGLGAGAAAQADSGLTLTDSISPPLPDLSDLPELPGLPDPPGLHDQPDRLHGSGLPTRVEQAKPAA